jgi:hypothetical protein
MNPQRFQTFELYMKERRCKLNLVFFFIDFTYNKYDTIT